MQESAFYLDKSHQQPRAHQDFVLRNPNASFAFAPFWVLVLQFLVLKHLDSVGVILECIHCGKVILDEGFLFELILMKTAWAQIR